MKLKRDEPLSILAFNFNLRRYIPFNPEYCVYFEMGDFASLAGLHVSPGKVEPAFAPDGRGLTLIRRSFLD